MSAWLRFSRFGLLALLFASPVPALSAAPKGGLGVPSAAVQIFIDRPVRPSGFFQQLFSPGQRRITGSGVIVRSDGLVVTSAHVVKDGVHPVVRFADDRFIPATVLLEDDRADVAVLKLSSLPTPLTPLSFSAALAVGDWVEAFGSTLGGPQTPQFGHVKALPMTAPGIADFPPFIETDVRLSPGYSGGPLVNARGEIVGIDSAIYSRFGRFDGVSFAIPAEAVERVLVRAEALDAKGGASPSPGLPGVALTGREPLGGSTVADLTPALARDYGLPPTTPGVLVIDPGHGYADQSGFQIGDLVVAINNTPVTSTASLVSALSGAGAWRVDVKRGARALSQDFSM